MRQAYPYGGYADYFQEMERLEQFQGMTLRKASTSLFFGGSNNAGLNTKTIKVRSSNTSVRSPEIKKPFPLRAAHSGTH